MWVCPECKTKNATISDFCTVCGTSPDGLKKAAKTQHPKDVGVTQRFSVGTFMIMIAFFGVLFAIMKMLKIHPIIFADVAIFFAGIGAAQAIFFKGRDPRKASWVAGFVLGPLVGIATILFANLFTGFWVFSTYNNHLGQWTKEGIVAYGIIFIILGGPFGYLAGCLIAGIFLVRERESDKEIDTQGTFDDDEEED
jgi:hypothetical protein